jgi:hypothetical protein
MFSLALFFCFCDENNGLDKFLGAAVDASSCCFESVTRAKERREKKKSEEREKEKG